MTGNKDSEILRPIDDKIIETLVANPVCSEKNYLTDFDLLPAL